MAAKGSITLLGYVDENINPNGYGSLDYTANKIGGKPEWCCAGGKVPMCMGCNRRMLLVTQVYSPLEGSTYHRTLYLFACITPECWNKPHSWICFRGQIPADPKKIKAPTPTISDFETSDMWLEDENEWDDCSNFDDGNGNSNNLGFNSDLKLDNLKLADNPSMSTNNRDTLNLNQQNANLPSAICDVTRSMERKLNLNQDDSNANENACGAVGMQCSSSEMMEASAIIEGSEGDVVSLESPQKIVTDIPALFKNVTRLEGSDDLEFKCYFIASDFEPKEDTRCSDHERELLIRYNQATGHEFREDAREYMGGNNSNEGDGFYEKVAAHHGDSLLHKFKKRALRSPQQIMRYCRDDVSPLWLQSPRGGDIPPCCSHCRSRLIFEFQLMPQLVNALRIRDVKGSVLEFGTIVVFTCADSCWKDCVIREEIVVVQGEPT